MKVKMILVGYVEQKKQKEIKETHTHTKKRLIDTVLIKLMTHITILKISKYLLILKVLIFHCYHLISIIKKKKIKIFFII